MTDQILPRLRHNRAGFLKHTPGGVLLKHDRESLIRATIRGTKADRADVIAALEREERKT
jgi:hypothetical protein